jgi:hypothetical protein
MPPRTRARPHPHAHAHAHTRTICNALPPLPRALPLPPPPPPHALRVECARLARTEEQACEHGGTMVRQGFGAYPYPQNLCLRAVLKTTRTRRGGMLPCAPTSR